MRTLTPATIEQLIYLSEIEKRRIEARLKDLYALRDTGEQQTLDVSSHLDDRDAPPAA